MKPEEVLERVSPGEIRFFTSRSSGPGGQNVNKVNTRVELRFNINNTTAFSDQEKEMILVKLKNRISNEGELSLTSQSERTQLRNKEKVIIRFCTLLASALTPKPVRKPTIPTFASTAERLKSKRLRAEKKKIRQSGGREKDL